MQHLPTSSSRPMWRRRLFGGIVASIVLVVLASQHAKTKQETVDVPSLHRMALSSRGGSRGQRKPSESRELGESHEWKSFEVASEDGKSAEFIRRHQKLAAEWDPKDIGDSHVNIVLHKLERKPGTDSVVYEPIGLLAKKIPNNGRTVISVPDEININKDTVTFIELQPVTAPLTNREKLRSDPLYALKADFIRHIIDWGKKVVKKVYRKTVQQVARETCQLWSRSDPGNPPRWAKQLPRCPRMYPFGGRSVCATIKNTFYADGACQNGKGCNSFHAGAYNCIRAMSGPYGQQCCYARNNRICVGIPCGGTADFRGVPKNKWRHPGKVVNHFVHDVKPFMNCCTLSGNRHLCNVYMKLRPIDAGHRAVRCSVNRNHQCWKVGPPQDLGGSDWKDDQLAVAQRDMDTKLGDLSEDEKLVMKRIARNVDENDMMPVMNVKSDGPHWRRVPGILMQVAISAHGTLYGVNSAHNIFTKAGWNKGNWVHIPGKLTSISVSNDGRTVIGTNVHGNVYVRVGTSHHNIGGSRWAAVGSGFKMASAGANYEYLLSKGGHVFRKSGKHYCKLSGILSQISAHGTNVVGTISGSIFGYTNTHGRNTWNRLPGWSTWASMGADGEFWCISHGRTIYRSTNNGQNWHKIDGSLKQIDVANRGNIAGVNRHDHIYVWA